MNLGQFFGLTLAASNIVGDNTSVYTSDMFSEDFPQFTEKPDHSGYRNSFIPLHMLDSFIKIANAVIQETRWFEKWRWAMGLYIAHYATLYLRMFSDGSSSARGAANSGALIGVVSSSTLGDTSVTYDTRALVAATEKWGAWNSTSYGQLLVTEARLVSMGGSFII